MMSWLPKKDLFALDFGTTKFCIASLIENQNQQTLRPEITSVDAQGMHRGMLADVEKAGSALNHLLELSEHHFGCDIQSVAVGVSGSHLDGFRAWVSVPLHGQVCTPFNLVRLAEIAEASNGRDGKEILHCVPITYRIDNREPVQNPIGFSGQILHGEYLMIFADRHYLADIVRVCNQSGLQVGHLFAEPLASASVIMCDEMKNRGAAIADIGGGTTDGIVFQNGRPHAVFTVNIAGLLMSRDLALGLSVSLEEAERIKCFFGLGTDDTSQSLEVKGLRVAQKLIVWRDVFQILAPRVRELTNLLVRELLPFKGTLTGGLILTGGGAGVKGIAPYIADALKIPVETAKPTLAAFSGLYTNPQTGTGGDLSYASKYATVLGLLNLQLAKLHEGNHARKAWPSRYLGQFVNWLKELS